MTDYRSPELRARRGMSRCPHARSISDTRRVRALSEESGRRFGVTVIGRIHAELRPRPSRPVENEIASLLDRLDGRDRFSAMLWALPLGQPFDRVP